MNADSRTLAYRLGLAGAAAAAILALFVLPAEYDIDITGFGDLTGLTALAQEVPAGFDGVLELDIADYDSSAPEILQSVPGLIRHYDAHFQTATLDIAIEDLGEVEYKFIMAEGDTLVYAWQVLEPTGDGVYFDFHGHPPSAEAANYPDGFEMAYSRGEGLSQHAAFTAPFGGYHGFYFLNLQEGPIVVRLTVAGHWSDRLEMYRAVDSKVITAVEF